MASLWSDDAALLVGRLVLDAGGFILVALIAVGLLCLAGYAGFWLIVGPRNVLDNWSKARRWVRKGSPEWTPERGWHRVDDGAE